MVDSYKSLFYLIIYTLFLNVSLIIYELLIPYYFKVVQNQTNLLGVTLSIQATGAIIASALIVVIKSNRYLTCQTSIKALSFSFIPLLLPNQYAFMLAAFLIGFFSIMFNVLFFSHVQERTQKEYMGRVISTVYFISAIGMPVGSMSFSYLFSLDYNVAIYLLLGYTLASLVVFTLLYNKVAQDD